MSDQASLGDFGADVPADEDETPGGNADEDGTQSYSKLQLAMKDAPDNAEPFADDSCPWCLAPSDDFDESGDTVSCTNCDARIPVGADWYQRGEKICY